jgi:hypothetical protein
MNLRHDIKRILREETTKDYTSLIESILTNLFVADHKDEVCRVKVVHPREQMQLHRPEQYSVIFYFKGFEFKFLPKSHLKEELMNEAWDLVYNYTGQRISMWSEYVKDCSDIIQENKSSSIPNMIKTLGLYDSIRYFGGYDKIMDLIGDYEFSNEEKIEFIRDAIKHLTEKYHTIGISIYDLGMNSVTFGTPDPYGLEFQQIEYFNPEFVTIDVYDRDSHKGNFKEKYENLDDNTLDNVFIFMIDAVEHHNR